METVMAVLLLLMGAAGLAIVMHWYLSVYESLRALARDVSAIRKLLEKGKT